MSSDEGESRSTRSHHRENLFADDDVEVSGSGSDRSRSDGERGGRRSGSGSENEDKGKKTDSKSKKPKQKKTGPVKRVLLGEDDLCGKNGILKLPEMFKDFKFQGKGKEAQDLDSVLHKLEHWVHMLNPRHPFDQTLERIEHLGIKKRAVKTYIKKIRMDLVSSSTGAENDFENLPDMGMSSDEEGKGHGQPNSNNMENTQNKNSASGPNLGGDMEIDEENLFDDDDDFDNIINKLPEDEELLSQLQTEKNENPSLTPSEAPLSGTKDTNPKPTDAIVVDDDEFDRMMAEAGM